MLEGPSNDEGRGVRRRYKQLKGKLDAGLPTGYPAAGEVIALGSEVEGLRIGDRAPAPAPGFANHAEVIDVPVYLVVRIPEGLAYGLASTVTLRAIAMQGVRRAAPTLGETVVVVGLGILGQITAQLLWANGCRVIVTDIDPARITTAKANGLEIGLIPAEGDVVDRIVKLTEGFGADAVIITAASLSMARVRRFSC